MGLDLVPLLDAVLEEYALPLNGVHGVAHWARVLENGLVLARETGADVEVVQYFAVLHDACRLSDYSDPEHGPRAAELALRLNPTLLGLSTQRLRLLHRACHGHTHERTHPDATIQTCWDADRLDLGRVGVTPHPSRLCTEAARRPQILQWADGRATYGVAPKLIAEEWLIDLETIRFED